MIFRQKGLEVGGGDMLRAGLLSRPLHTKAVGQTAEHPQDPQCIVTLDAASVIVVGDIQALVQSAFNPPSLTIERQPVLGRKDRAWSTGNQSHRFGPTALGVAQESGGLGDEREAYVFGTDRSGANGPALQPAFVALLGPGLRGCGMLRGENPLAERRLSFRC